MEDNNKLRDMITASLSNIRSMLDANTIIGDPIVTSSGTTIIPVSKISVGYVSGGLDYNKKKGEKEAEKTAPANFGGGGGTGISVSPVAFIVIDSEGKAEMLSITAPAGPTDTASQIVNIVDRSPEIIEKIKGIFKKKDKENTK